MGIDLIGYGYSWLYRRLPTPRLRIAALSPTSDALFRGEMLRATSDWWNRYLDKRPALATRGGMQHLTAEHVEKQNGAIQPLNRVLFDAMGAEHAPTAPRLGAAALTLSYSLARTLHAGDPRWNDEALQIIWSRADTISLDTFEHYSKRYTMLADYQMWEQSPGWWVEEAQG